MIRSEIGHFPGQRLKTADNDGVAAEAARQRIAGLPDHYRAVANPTRESLAGKVVPVSPAAEAAMASGDTSSAPEPVTLLNQPYSNKADPVSKNAPSVHPHAKTARFRVLSGRLKPIAIGILTFGLLLLVFKAPIFLQQVSYLTNKPAASSVAPVATVTGTPTLTIPKINVSAPVVFAKSNVEASIQKDLEGGVVHYSGTAIPGENGNSVIFGHSSNDWWEPGNYKFVFVLLDKLVLGDTFTVSNNGVQYIYQVTETKIVQPTDVAVLNGNGTAEMTLITCTPPGTSWKRLVVKAKQTSPAPKTDQVEVKTDGSVGSLPNGTLTSNSAGVSDQIGKWWQGLTSLFRGN